MVSNAGNITIRQAGLAALVAPQVANSGTITARLGRVILGGAETHTLDLYGDGLVALNVTGQVTKASLGGKQVAALVTNSGTILAPGGTVVLTAAAADGVVTNLVEAGGKVSAQSVGAQTGRVLVQGIGGGISIDGDVSATGVDAGTKGGQVVANATGAVRVGPRATVDASGDSGGGVVAIGTTSARAIGGVSVTPHAGGAIGEPCRRIACQRQCEASWRGRPDCRAQPQHDHAERQYLRHRRGPPPAMAAGSRSPAARWDSAACSMSARRKARPDRS